MKTLTGSIVLAALLPLGSLAFAQAEDPNQKPDGSMEQPADTPQADDKAKPDKPAGDARPERREGERGERRRGRRGRFGGGMLPVEQLRGELGLSDEQAEKLQALNTEMRERMQSMREAMQDGTLDREAMRNAFRQGREEMQAKLGEILTPEQMEKMREMRQRFGRRGQRGERGRRGPNREELAKRLREDAVKSLALGEEESAVVLPLLDGVLETRKLLNTERDQRRERFLEKVRNPAEGDDLGQLLTEYRAARDADRATLAKAQEQLREVLTLEQEAKLVGMNILD